MALIAALVGGYTANGKNGTLVRNSLVASPQEEEHFFWKPGNEPNDYVAETLQAPEWLAQKFRDLNIQGDGLDAVIAAIRVLHAEPFKGKAIRKDLRTTWRLIHEEGRGYCADFSKVFNALMLLSDIPVREWALGWDNFGSGHTFNEVYIASLNKWVFVDAFNGMLVLDAITQEPLSVLEFRRRLAERRFDGLIIDKHTSPDLFFQTTDEAIRYYARSSDYFYLIWGNNVFSYDAHPIVRKSAEVARFLERFVAIGLGQYPELRLLVTETNAAAIREIRWIGIALLTAVVAEVVLGALLLWILLGGRTTRTASGRNIAYSNRQVSA